jgi:hypothetical protein
LGLISGWYVLSQEFDDLAQGLEGTQVFGLNGRRFGHSLLKGGEDFDPFDGINPEVGIEAHVEFEHFDGVAGFLGDDAEEGFFDGVQRDPGFLNRSRLRNCRLDRGTDLGREEFHDLTEGLKGDQVFGLDSGGSGETLLKGGEDFDPFDGVNSEVGIEAHVEFEHFDGVPGFLGDDGEKNLGRFGRWSSLSRWHDWNRHRSRNSRGDRSLNRDRRWGISDRVGLRNHWFGCCRRRHWLGVPDGHG